MNHQIVQAELVVYECHRCGAIAPYDGAPHNCPVNNEEEDEGFVEDPLVFAEFAHEVNMAQGDPWVLIYFWLMTL